MTPPILPQNLPDQKEFKLFVASREFKFKLLLSDIDLGSKLPWDGNRHFTLKFRTTLEQLRIDPIEYPKIFCETEKEDISSLGMILRYKNKYNATKLHKLL